MTLNTSPVCLEWQKRLDQRRQTGQLRRLKSSLSIDFCSNDYLGWAKHKMDYSTDTALTVPQAHGATGSRLLSGQSALISQLEQQIAEFHCTESALIFNSGYDANLGVLAAIGDRHAVFIYDEWCHASLIDGMRLSLSRSMFKFKHNDIDDLKRLLDAHVGKPIVLVLESVYSMDGDIAPLTDIVRLAEQYQATLVVDEAHATGVIGTHGEGLVQTLGLEQKVAVKIHTFGKAMGCHGAAVVGSELLIDLLVNFARSFIYTTALPPASYAAIARAYHSLQHNTGDRQRLNELITYFQTQIRTHTWLNTQTTHWIESTTPIQGLIVGNANQTKKLAEYLQQHDLDVRPILAPTVPAGTERLRICLHAFNTETQIDHLLNTLEEGLL